MTDNKKRQKRDYVLLTVLQNIVFIIITGIYCWCLVSAYANFAPVQLLKISVTMMILFIVEMALDHLVFTKAMRYLQLVIQGMTITIWVYRANWIMLIVLFIVEICYVFHVILLYDNMEEGTSQIGRMLWISMMLLEAVYIFRLAGGCIDRTYEKSILTLVLISIGCFIIIAKEFISKCLIKIKRRLQKRGNSQRWSGTDESCYTGPVNTISFSLISIIMFLYIGVISLGMNVLDAEIYRDRVFRNYDVRTINAEELFSNQERLYQTTRNEDGSITSCGNDSYIVICWQDFGITTPPHNMNIIIQSMTQIYERGQVYSFDNDIIESRDIDFISGENNISLEHLPDSNAFVRIDFTDYDAMNFLITEVRINDYMPYVSKIKESSFFLVGLSLITEIILVAYVIRKRGRENRGEKGEGDSNPVRYEVICYKK